MNSIISQDQNTSQELTLGFSIKRKLFSEDEDQYIVPEENYNTFLKSEELATPIVWNDQPAYSNYPPEDTHQTYYSKASDHPCNCQSQEYYCLKQEQPIIKNEYHTIWEPPEKQYCEMQPLKTDSRSFNSNSNENTFAYEGEESFPENNNDYQTVDKSSYCYWSNPDLSSTYSNTMEYQKPLNLTIPSIKQSNYRRGGTNSSIQKPFWNESQSINGYGSISSMTRGYRPRGRPRGSRARARPRGFGGARKNESLRFNDDLTLDKNNLKWLLDFKVEGIFKTNQNINKSNQKENAYAGKMSVDENKPKIHCGSLISDAEISEFQKSNNKSEFNYSELISMVLEQRGPLTVSEIYYFLDVDPSRRNKNQNWKISKNSIRYNLTINDLFRRSKERTSRGFTWDLANNVEEKKAKLFNEKWCDKIETKNAVHSILNEIEQENAKAIKKGKEQYKVVVEYFYENPEDSKMGECIENTQG